MAGAKRRSYKKKGVSRRRKSGRTKRKSTKKTGRSRRAYTKKEIRAGIKAGRKLRRQIQSMHRRKARGPSLGEMAFVVANYHPAAEAAANAQSMQQAMASISQQSDNQMLPLNF